MPDFIVRVELHGGQNRYDELHKLMRAKKLYRGFMQGKIAYRLLPAEYWFRGAATAADVLQLAVAAVNAMKPPFPPGKDTGPDVDGTSAILVTAAELPLVHAGLKKIPPAKKSPAK